MVSRAEEEDRIIARRLRVEEGHHEEGQEHHGESKEHHEKEREHHEEGDIHHEYTMREEEGKSEQDEKVERDDQRREGSNTTSIPTHPESFDDFWWVGVKERISN
jgi:hypothetical protein